MHVQFNPYPELVPVKYGEICRHWNSCLERKPSFISTVHRHRRQGASHRAMFPEGGQETEGRVLSLWGMRKAGCEQLW